MEYHLTLPVPEKDITKLHIGDIIYLSGTLFTARDEAHQMMLEQHRKDLPFDPSQMALYHCGPLMKQTSKGWNVVSAGPTTSSRMEIFEDTFIKTFKTKIIIGKGGMGKRTLQALENYTSIYAAYTGGAGALAAEKVTSVPAVYWLDELGMPEAVWIFEVKEFGPLIVAMDSHNQSLYNSK